MAKNTLPKRVIPPEAHKLARDIDLSVLSAEKVADITERARVKVLARMQVEAEEELLEREMARIDAEFHPEEQKEYRDVYIDLAPYADRVTLDGKVFYFGHTYSVERGVYDVLQECMSKTFKHDAEIHGNTGDQYYMKSRQYQMSGKTGAATAAGGAPVRF